MKAEVARGGGKWAALQLGVALGCLAVGEAFIFLRWPPVTDFYFILVWGGYILLVDYLVYWRSGRSLLRDAPGRLLAMFPLSAVFWWIFEAYDQFVDNWLYQGGGYEGLAYVLVASLFFSTVVPAVWETAELLLTFWGDTGSFDRLRMSGGDRLRMILRQAPLESRGARDVRTGETPVPPGPNRPCSPLDERGRGEAEWDEDLAIPASARPSVFASAWPGVALSAGGLVLSVLPLVAPLYAFPLVWVGLFVLLDPLNARAGRPSILAMLRHGQWRVPAAFYLGTTVTGFFWEFWNYWAWPKWVYTLPALVDSFPRLFEMPLPGYLGYGPFGWELFAMWWFGVGLWRALAGRGLAAGRTPSEA